MRFLPLLLLVVVSACGEPVRDTAAADRAQDLRDGEVLAGSGDIVARRAAAKRLAARQGLAPEVLRPLGAALQDPDRWVRESAAIALREQGPAALHELPALIAALRDADEYVRWRVAEALGRIGPAAAAAREALAVHAGDDHEVEVVRAASQRALERIGPPAGAPPVK